MGSYAPAILEERAALVDALGLPAKATQQRRDALGLYRAMGATGHAERLARALESQ